MTQYKFINEQREKQYQEATHLLELEISRQKDEAAALKKEWDGLPYSERTERLSMLELHHQRRLEPCVRLLTDIIEKDQAERSPTDDQADSPMNLAAILKELRQMSGS